MPTFEILFDRVTTCRVVLEAKDAKHAEEIIRRHDANNTLSFVITSGPLTENIVVGEIKPE